MAAQNPNPGPWDNSMSDGGTAIPDKLILSGSAHDVFVRHDHDYHFGGSLWDKIKADARMAWGLLKKPGSWKLISLPAFLAVSTVGIKYFNWKGPGVPSA
ncbi:hypothetical protein LCGC14_0355090 [marine sediment metagenome]|uniref:Uncharacterized protein n=1 Tax=marine sediment metagenome TaxID=412755 RepID=A0A0F9TFA8_9ZZZZ